MHSRTNFARLAAIAISFIAPAALMAVPITGGTTTVTFDAGTLGTLTSAGFSIAPINPATLTGPSAVFPITGGDSTTDIFHSGGLALSKSGTTALLENFDIKLTTSTLLGQVIVGSTTMNAVPLFTITTTGGTTNLLLSSYLAGAITQVFGVTLPTGTLIGTAVVAPNAVPEPATVGLAGLALLGVTALARRQRFTKAV